MKARTWLTAAVVAALLAPGLARAQGLEGKFSIAFQGGTQSEIAGDLMKGVQGTLIDKPAALQSIRYKDVYAPDLRLQGLLGFGVGEKLEIIARGTWYKADGTGVEAGTREDLPVYAFFEDYEEVGFEVGLRYYLASAGRLKSYLAPVAGARFLTEVLVSFSVPEAGSALLNVPFTEKSTVAVFGLDIGFNFDLTDHLFAGLDSGIRYQAAPSPFAGFPGLSGINESDGKWSAPVAVTVGVRF